MTNERQGKNLSQSTTARRQRGSVACRRCRRLRVKCIHASTSPPCDGCKAAGREYADQCTFPKRGEIDVDRDWRSRGRSRNLSGSEGSRRGIRYERHDHSTSAAQEDPALRDKDGQMDYRRQSHVKLPTEEEMVESCRVFVTSYFQLGFIPKATFSERVANHEVSEFLILCILCLSARFTPCLIAKHGSGAKATEFYSDQALRLVPEKMYCPDLENTQGFFLLSIAEWGNGDRERSSIHMGVAVRMAAMLKLHREETYSLPENASQEEIINAEMSRRTFWMIQSQDNLHSGYNSPAPFSLDDITALLPCEESDFVFGVLPHERAALQGTVPAIADNSLTGSPRRSLFATLIQAHSLWGQVARKACVPSHTSQVTVLTPLGSNSDYIRIIQALGQFEERLPSQQKWSTRNLRAWKDFGFELAFLSVVMILRLSNIIVRRMYLEDIKSCLTDSSVDSNVRQFWQTVSNELFQNVEELHEQIESSYAIRSHTQAQAFPAILVLPVYVCGSLALNLWKCPDLCPSLATKAAEILTRCLHFITELQLAWPMAKNWQQGLQQAATPLSCGPSPSLTIATPQTQSWGTPKDVQLQPPQHILENISPSGRIEGNSHHHGSNSVFDPSLEIGTLPNDIFDAEVTAFLQGEAHFGFWDM